MIAKTDATIKLDFDENGQPNLAKLEAMLSRIDRVWTSMELRRSPGGQGWHVLLTVEPPPVSAMEVVALQAVLGSDPWREVLQIERARNYHRAPAWMKRCWNVLYMPDKRRERHFNFRRMRRA